MSFLRDNLFTAALGGGTAVLCLVLLGWGYVISGDIEDEEAKREGLAKQITSLKSGRKVNTGTINSERTRVQNILKSLADVRKQNVEWNSRNFRVPDLPLDSDQLKAALPFDSTIWDRYSLAFYFISDYHDQIDGLLARLKPTTTPSEEEIDAETTRQAARLQQMERIQEKGTRNASETEERRDQYATRNSRDGGRMGEDVGDKALKRAKKSLRLLKAKEGLIYAEVGCFNERFLRGQRRSTIKAEEVWEAQVGLWVRSDVVAVLEKTIQQVQQNLPEKDRNVINSPIKKLIRIEIEGDSSDTVSSTKQKGGVGVPSLDMGRPPGMDMMMPRGGRGGRGGRPPMGIGPRGMTGRPGRPSSKGSRRGSSSQQLDKPETLTQNTANPVFDVVNYSFTVLMPTRFLPLLEKNLMEQNYHLILNEQIKKVSENADSKEQSSDLFYYGADPVCEVTIEAQLLLLADWTRGMWDAKDKKWLRPPLMPVEVMQTLSSGALRNEDNELISEKLPMPWKGSTEEAK